METTSAPLTALNAPQGALVSPRIPIVLNGRKVGTGATDFQIPA